MATKTLLTIEQYMALGEDPPGMRYELSDGELIVTPSSNYFHNEIRDRFNARLRTFLGTNPLGIVTSETDVKLGGNIVRRPDVAFIHKDRLPGVDLGHIPLAAVPNLVIEIVSPTDRAADLRKKTSQYFDAGVQSIWFFYPEDRLTYRHAADRLEPKAFSENDEFSEPALLPGFTLKISEIFTWGNDPMNASGPLPSQDTGGH